jgi:xanthine dehydrogenase accessory factor
MEYKEIKTVNIYDEIIKAQKAKKDFAVLTIVKSGGSVPRHENPKMIAFTDGRSIGTIGGGSLEKQSIDEAVKAIRKGDSKLLKINSDKSSAFVCGGNAEVFIEVHKLKPRLILCGAGHVNKAVSYIAGTVNFDITVIDSRPEWANNQRFSEADSIVIDDDMGHAIEEQSTNENTFFVIATWDHKWDKDALKSALKKQHKYIGMIASKRKIQEVFELLKSEGVEQWHLDKVYTPVGLDIKAETPEEIAISVMSEVLMVKNNASGLPLSKII